MTEPKELGHLDAAINYLEHAQQEPRDAMVRTSIATTAIALAAGIEPTPALKLHADRWLLEVLSAHRSHLRTVLRRPPALAEGRSDGPADGSSDE